MGCNAVRVPFNYRHFESDLEPFAYNDSAFGYLDRVVQLCKKYGIYVILDMHAVPGYQNPDWHCDNYTREARLYRSGSDQERMCRLWRYIASHYKDETAVAGYDIMNEPRATGSEEVEAFNGINKKVVKAIREVDKHHIVFIEGNAQGNSFEGVDEPFDDNLVYSAHFYPYPSIFQTTGYPGVMEGTTYDRNYIEREIDIRDGFMKKHNVPCWFGEFGILELDPRLSEDRKRILTDMLDVLNERGHSWTIWSYKDIGNMGIVHSRPDSPWTCFTSEIRRLKEKYHCDFDAVAGFRWDMVDLLKPHFEKDFCHCADDVYSAINNRLGDIFNSFLADRFASELACMSISELETLIASFRFGNCVAREDWKEIVSSRLK